MKVLAIDLGGTSAKVALFNNGDILNRWKVSTDKNNLWKNIVDNLEGLKEKDYDVVSISMPGFIDHKNMIVTLAGNLNLKNYNVMEKVSPFFGGKKVYVLNDANSATLGEFWKGAAAKDGSTILYTIGTGIGGGIIVNGNLVYGSKGYAGELGHGGYFQDKYPCTCGLKHCVEPVSSATGLTKLLKEKGFDLSVQDAGELLKKGNKDIEAIFIEGLTPLAKHIATMECAINPDSIIIGGGPSAIGEPLRLIIENLVAKYQLDFIHKETPIKLATTKNDAGVYGAAYWAMIKAR